MGISIFLAKLIGLYFLIMSFLCLFRKHQIDSTCKEVSTSKGLLAVSAELSILFGLVIAIDHSIWEWSWRGLITVLGYLMILRGVLRLGFPNVVKKWYAKMQKACWVCLIIMILIGIYLTYCGFTYGAANY